MSLTSPHAACSLEYVKEAVAEADPVTKMADMIKQRRRWLNGTFFAMIYTLSNWSRIWTESHHTVARKMVLSAEFIYLTALTIAGTWFGIGVFYTILSQLIAVTFGSSAWMSQANSEQALTLDSKMGIMVLT